MPPLKLQGKAGPVPTTQRCLPQPRLSCKEVGGILANPPTFLDFQKLRLQTVSWEPQRRFFRVFRLRKKYLAFTDICRVQQPPEGSPVLLRATPLQSLLGSLVGVRATVRPFDWLRGVLLPGSARQYQYQQSCSLSSSDHELWLLQGTAWCLVLALGCMGSTETSPAPRDVKTQKRSLHPS